MTPALESSRLESRVRRHAVAPTVAIRVWLRGGQLLEPAPGLAVACGRLLAEGTASHTWRDIVELSERRGMDVSGFGAPECLGVSVDALAVDWVEALELASEMALAPSFPSERCDWIRRQMGAELESLSEQPEVLTGWAFLEQLYGDHPFGQPLIGTHDGLERIDPATCATLHRASLEGGVLVSVAGEIEEEVVADRVAACFGDLLGESATPAGDLPEPRSRPGEHHVELPPADQAQVLLGRLTVRVSDPDYVPLELASVILGSGPGLVGRLPERVRERDGLAYAISVLATSGAGGQLGRLTVHAGTAPQRVDELIDAARDELSRLVSSGVTPDEVREAKRFLLGSDPFRRETARQIAGLQAQSMLLGRPFDDPAWLTDALEPLEASDLDAVARRHLDPEVLSVTIGVPTGDPRL